MWLKVSALEGDSVFGVLDSDPGMTTSVVSGDRIRKPVADGCVWLLLDRPAMRGGFTLAAVRKIATRQRGEDPPPSAPT